MTASNRSFSDMLTGIEAGEQFAMAEEIWIEEGGLVTRQRLEFGGAVSDRAVYLTDGRLRDRARRIPFGDVSSVQLVTRERRTWAAAIAGVFGAGAGFLLSVPFAGIGGIWSSVIPIAGPLIGAAVLFTVVRFIGTHTLKLRVEVTRGKALTWRPPLEGYTEDLAQRCRDVLAAFVDACETAGVPVARS